MSNPQIGYAGKIQVAPDASDAPGSYAVLGGQSKFTVTLKGEAIDITQFNSAGYRERMLGLKDADISLEFYREPGDTAQSTLLNSLVNGTRVWVQCYQDATHNVVVSCYCSEFPFEGDPTAANKVSAKLVFDGTPSSPFVIT